MEKIGKGVLKEPVDERLKEDPVLLPLCDVAGYACFVTWAFVVGWERGVAPLGESGFFVLRCVFFGGVAFSTLILFFSGGKILAAIQGKVYEAFLPLLSMCCAVTLYLLLPGAAVAVLWFVSGIGQAAMFFLWGARFRVLSRRQQLYAVCGAFVIGGVSLAVFPFVDPSVVMIAVTLLPAVSYVLLLFAYRQYAGKGDQEFVQAPLGFSGGLRRLGQQIPFEEDRRFIFLKGLFTLLYSVSLGFITCACLSVWLYPGNSMVIGLGNIVAALMMVVILHEDKHEINVLNILPKLFLPVTSFCFLLLGALWPDGGVLLCVVVLFILFGCYEILNAHTAYAYSSYDAARCLWELYSSKTGNSVGFFLGWLFATVSLFVFECDTAALLVICLSLVSLAVVIDTTLFKEMKLEFHEVVIGNEPAVEVLDPKSIESVLQGRGRWGRTCDDLAERYRLSPRQKEIFFLLAKGRNVQFIKDELVLSTPTVKSHIYNIYQKIGIHSHQELLDLVEKSVKES